jgi:RecJ-like exonuclease
MMDIYKTFDNIVKQTPVWTYGGEQERVDCELCGGEGYFVVTSKYQGVQVNLECPICHGVGKKGKTTIKPKQILLDGIYRLSKYLIMVKDEQGKSYNLDDIFETEAECQEEIDRENKGNE